MVQVSYHVTEVHTAKVRLFADVQGAIIAGTAGINRVAEDVAAQARRNLGKKTHGSNQHPHTRDQVVVEKVSQGGSVVLQAAEITPFVTASVGIDSKAWPMLAVGSTLERGWYPKSGMMPNVDNLAVWVKQRHLVQNPTEKKIRRMAFAIAKNMKARPGYTFGTYPWLSNAWHMYQSTAAETVSHYIGLRSSLQARDAGGRYGSFL